MATTVEELAHSAATDPEPPDGLAPEVEALWLAKAGRWEESHNIAQDIGSKMGSWIHAHLHLIEGDIWNAGYWYRKAGKPERKPEEIDQEWEVIAKELLGK